MKNYNFFKFLISVILIAIYSGCSDDSEKTAATQYAPIQVEVGKLKKLTFNKSILVQGNIQALDDAIISAKVAGTIDKLNVSRGDRVKKNEVLFQTDRKNLENQLRIAEQSLQVAKENCKTVEQDIKIAETNLRKAELDFERYKKLVKSRVISMTTFEDGEAAVQRTKAILQKEKTVLDYSQVKVEQAKTNLEIAGKNLADSIVTAPFNGVITDKFQEPGEYVAAGAKVLMLENIDQLEITARISSVYYDLIKIGTKVHVLLDGRELAEVAVSYISPTIDHLSRTFEIKANLPTDLNLICGSLCDMQIILAERQGEGIESNAIIARSGGRNSIFIVRDGKVEEVYVDIGFTTDGYTEILDSHKLKNAEIVISGQYFINNNDSVIVKNQESK